MNIEQANLRQNSFIQNGKHTYFSQAMKILTGVIFYALFVALSALAANAATFTVTNVNDSGAGSLRQAILSANALPNEAHTINFNIGTGLKTINPTSALPTIATNSDVTIDGTTQGGFASVPLIELSGANAGGSANGLNINSFNGSPVGIVTIKSLIVNRFAASGIRATNMKALNVYGCYIGTDSNGSTDLGNAVSGIYLSPAENGSTSNIGGAGANQRNVISGNNGSGVNVYGFYPANVKIAGNYIGTNASAIIDIGNSGSGIFASDFDGNVNITIGGTTTAERNVISGNNQNGITIGLVNSMTILGNYIGLGANGLNEIGNSQDGINFSLEGEVIDNVTIGGATSGAGNTISANGGDGIEIGYYDSLGLGTISPLVLGNRIGTDPNGSNDHGNAQNGILVTGLASPVIGRANAGEGNIISGNDGAGIYFSGGTGQVYNNRIGVSNLGAALGNAGSGIHAIGGFNLKIGDEAIVNSSNIIGSNGLHGIFLGGGSDSFKIANNLIGTNAQSQNLGNGGSGIFVGDSAHNGRIGSLTGSGNTIAFNTGNGVSIGLTANQTPPDSVSILRNSIFSNTGRGIDLNNNGITPNDAGDADTGANDLQNFPNILGASPAQINGSFNSTANESFRLEFFRVDSCDAGGSGEGRYYVGSTDAATDASGNATFLATGIALTTGQIITATATQKDQFGNLLSTSEFSPCQTVSQPPGNLALSAANYAVNESSNTATITVNRTNGTIGIIGVSYSTSDGTGVAGQDYTATNGTLTFQTGETTKSFTIPITDDQSDEPSETVNIALSNPTGGAAIVAPSSAVLTINDNDAPPQISANTISLAEGNEGTTAFNFTVTLSQPSAFPVSVNYATANGTATASVDYAATSGTLNFAPGETSKQVTVLVKGDTTPEIDEAFELVFSNPTNATVGSGGIGQILDDDSAGKLQFSATSYSFFENASSATITVTRTNGTAGTVSVNYATQNGTATAGADYQTASGVLTFLDGQQSATFTVPIIQDNTGEGDETVLISLSNALGGAGLGSPTNAVLTIADDDGGLPESVSISGKITASNQPLGGVSVTLAGSQSATATTDANGNYAFANLQAGVNYLVTPTLNNYNFEPGSLSFSNLTSDQANANFAASNGSPSRRVRLGVADTVANSPVIVPVELVAQGNENSVGFSLSFDGNLLFNPQIALGADAANASLVFNNSQAGKLGVIVALPAGQTFTAGTKRIVNVTFQTSQTELYSTPLTFVNQPVAGEVSDANADTLPVSFENGLVTFARGFEADVAPRPTGTGNGTVTVADYAQIGKFIAGNEQPDQLNEFQRADSAPRGTKGNGLLTVSDYAQAGRFAAALDAVQTAGGATAPLSLLEMNEFLNSRKVLRLDKSANAIPRVIRVFNTQTSPGAQVLVSIELESQGDENAAGFTLNYDAAKLSNPLVTLGSGAQGAVLFPNTNQAGKVGVVIGLPPGQSFQAGTRQLLTIRFDVSANAAPGATALTFSDVPVVREVVNANAEVLETDFNNGAIDILGTTAANVSISGRVLNQAGQPVSKALITLINSDGTERSVLSNGFGQYSFSDVVAGSSFVMTVASKNRIFISPTRVITANEDLAEIDFTTAD